MTCPQGISSALYHLQSWAFLTTLKYRANFAFLLETNTFNQCNAPKISVCLGCTNIMTQSPERS